MIPEKYDDGLVVDYSEEEYYRLRRLRAKAMARRILGYSNAYPNVRNMEPFEHLTAQILTEIEMDA